MVLLDLCRTSRTTPGPLWFRCANRLILRSRFDPLLQPPGLTHQDDLCDVILQQASGEAPTSPEPVTAAHEQGWAFRSILEGLARAQGKRPRFIPVPWRLAWLLIKSGEVCRLPLPFRSDSLVSLMNQNPRPSFELTRRLGLKFRPFQPETLKL